MVSANPFGDFRKECEKILQKSLNKLYPSTPIHSSSLDIPSSQEFGELASAAFFELGKKIRKPPQKLAEQIVAEINAQRPPLLKEAKVAGGGYVNFYANITQLTQLTIDSARKLRANYGYVKTEKPQKIIVEHTSANPIAPINIGKARNSILGDALARILVARGHKVSRRFYVDDVGRQTAVVAYGYNKLGKPSTEGKADHFIGIIYTLTSCIIEINRLKQAIEKEEDSTSETAQQLRKQLDEWDSIAIDLENKYTCLFSLLLRNIGEKEDTELTINNLNRAYEIGEEKAKALIRQVCQLCLNGIKETLSKAEIFFDSWDWESDIAWNSSVTKALEALKRTNYVFREGPVLEFDADKVAEDFQLKHVLGLKEDYEIPSLTLVRADGTTLYTTRDIPYTLWKFKKAEKVINVVGLEQRLPQMQLKLALWSLKHIDEAKNLVHFAHNLVTLPSYKMSSRRGRYITFDEVMDEAMKRAYEEVEKRSPQLSSSEKQEISRIVGIGALKYALVEVDPIKPVVFTWDRVINFERNSAPYLQYSYARARSILRKAANTGKPDYSLLVKPLEHDLALMLARFPEVFINSSESLKPSAVADYANLIADKFNSLYNALPVIKARPKALSDARLALVEVFSIVLRNALNLIGIVAPERM